MGRVEPAAARQPVALVALAVVALGLVFGLLLFAPAGRLDWALGWIYLGLVLVSVGATWVCLLRWNPGLIARRMHMGAGTKRWDVVWSVLFMPVVLWVYVAAGLEARDGGASLPLGAFAAGLLVHVAGSTLLTAAMVVNPFFEKTVRIQSERGHRVVDRGPYAFVRHPGYVGFAGWLAAAPLLLASPAAVAPAGLAIAGLVLRTALEDRTLRAELPGYAEYAKRVRFRLVPGIW